MSYKNILQKYKSCSQFIIFGVCLTINIIMPERVKYYKLKKGPR